MNIDVRWIAPEYGSIFHIMHKSEACNCHCQPGYYCKFIMLMGIMLMGICEHEHDSRGSMRRKLLRFFIVAQKMLYSGK